MWVLGSRLHWRTLPPDKCLWVGETEAHLLNSSSFTLFSSRLSLLHFLSLIFLPNGCFACAPGRCWDCFLPRWEAVSTWHLAVPLLSPAVRLGPRHPSARALFPQRPTLPPFSKDIFRSCCLASGKTFSLIGEQANRVRLCSECLLLCAFAVFTFCLACMSLSPHFTASFLSVSPLPRFFHFTFSIAVPSSNNLLTPQRSLRSEGKPSLLSEEYCTLRTKSLGCLVPQLNPPC